MYIMHLVAAQHILKFLFDQARASLLALDPFAVKAPLVACGMTCLCEGERFRCCYLHRRDISLHIHTHTYTYTRYNNSVTHIQTVSNGLLEHFHHDETMDFTCNAYIKHTLQTRLALRVRLICNFWKNEHKTMPPPSIEPVCVRDRLAAPNGSS